MGRRPAHLLALATAALLACTGGGHAVRPPEAHPPAQAQTPRTLSSRPSSGGTAPARPPASPGGPARAYPTREGPAAREEGGVALLETVVSAELASAGGSRVHDMLRAELEQDPELRPVLDGGARPRTTGRWVAATAFLSGAPGTQGRELVLEVRAGAGGRERRLRAEGSLFAQVAVVKDAARKIRAALKELSAGSGRPPSR